MEAEAKHEFQATAEDELSFPRGAILKVRQRRLDLIQKPSCFDQGFISL